MSDSWPASLRLANGAVLVASTIAQAQGQLLLGEEQLLADARPARRREIIAGRRMAHHAMSELGFVPAAVIMGANGAPSWPPGLCGSIAHSPQFIAVVVSSTGDIQSLGIDIEDGRDLGRAVADIASDADTSAILDLGITREVSVAARMVFSAKEALFKCQAPITGNMMLDFLEIGLVSTGRGALGVKFLPADPACRMAKLSDVRIYFVELQGVMLALAPMSSPKTLLV